MDYSFTLNIYFNSSFLAIYSFHHGDDGGDDDAYGVCVLMSFPQIWVFLLF